MVKLCHVLEKSLLYDAVYGVDSACYGADNLRYGVDNTLLKIVQNSIEIDQIQLCRFLQENNACPFTAVKPKAHKN